MGRWWRRQKGRALDMSSDARARSLMSSALPPARPPVLPPSSCPLLRMHMPLKAWMTTLDVVDEA